MNKFGKLLRFEFKGILRDPMTMMMLGFPVLLLVISCFVFPRVLQGLPQMHAMTARTVSLLMVLFISSFGGIMAGAMATFQLLDHKDENTLHTIAATPLGLSGYLAFKMAYVLLLAILSVFLVLQGTKWLAADAYTLMGERLLDRLSTPRLLLYSLSSGLLSPVLGLLLGGVARNKVEGFAWIKGTGLLALIPMLLVLPAFQGSRQYILGVFPNFWATKGLTAVLMKDIDPANLDFGLYMFISALYSLLLLVLAFRVFLRKQQY